MSSESGEKESSKPKDNEIDMGLVMRLQNRIKALETERDNMKIVIDERSKDSSNVALQQQQQLQQQAADSVRLQELESENVKLKDQLQGYRKAVLNSKEFEQMVATGCYGDKEVNNNDLGGVNRNNNTVVATSSAHLAEASKEMMRQFESMKEELERRSEECVQLKTMLATRALGQELIAKENFAGKAEIVNEDGELAVAYRWANRKG